MFSCGRDTPKRRNKVKLKREAPGNPRGGRRAHETDWVGIFAAVREAGGAWCRVPHEYSSQASALSTARSAQGAHGAIDIEVTSRKVGGRGVVYARLKPTA